MLIGYLLIQSNWVLHLRRCAHFAHRLRWDTFIYSFLETCPEGISAHGFILSIRCRRVSDHSPMNKSLPASLLPMLIVDSPAIHRSNAYMGTRPRSLRLSLQECAKAIPAATSWGLLLEFSIPRKEMRIDCVLLINGEIVILEAKTGSAFLQARKQLEEYSLLSALLPQSFRRKQNCADRCFS